MSKPRAIVYRRLSKDEAGGTGAGLAAQLDACNAWCAREGYDAVGPFDDVDVSGDTPLHERAGLSDAFAELRRGDALVVMKRDRLARSRGVVVMAEALLAKRKCRLASASGEGTDAADPSDPFAFIQRGISDLFAEYELLQTRWRVKMALRAKGRRNERTGRVPYGKDLVDDGRRSKVQADGKGGLPIALVENPAERRVLDAAFDLRRRGWTFGKIAWALNRRGIRTKAGKDWQASTIAYLCDKNGVQKGTITRDDRRPYDTPPPLPALAPPGPPADPVRPAP